ncbi:MAG: CoA-binding protein [Chloroflexota bacterium]|nr:CoA-binding protein [Chloroflexota bacterium]
MLVDQLNTAFNPRCIAIAGAMGHPFAMGYRYVSHLLNYGYQGRVYPITRNSAEVLGIKTYSSLKEIPESVDYVICCLPASQALDLIEQAYYKGVKVVHFFTGRFSETGQEDAARVEMEVLQRARELGIRLIGPNCMGIHYPKSGISFAYDMPGEPGRVSMFLQSGGAATQFSHYAALRGVRFSKVISYGNALDLNESDFLDYFSQDPETEVIAAYMEGIRDGTRFFRSLREATLRKPVIILKAGRSSAGARSAASHTAALSGSFGTWNTAMRQTGAIQAQSLDDMIDLVVSFDCLPPILGTRVGVLGGGGGNSVLAADEWEEAGFEVAPLPQEIEGEVRKLLPELWWGWLRNPIDMSIFPEEAFVTNLGGTIFRMMAQSSNFDLLVTNIMVGGPMSGEELVALVGNEVEDVLDIARKENTPVAVVLDTGALGTENFDDVRWKCLAQAKTKLLAARIPVYASGPQAANSIMRLIKYYRRREDILSTSTDAPLAGSR